MISPEEIRMVSFEKNMRGYRCDDVDAFLKQVAQDIESMTERIATLEKQKEEGNQKLYILAQKIEEYRADEDTLKTALLNAQRMGESVIREAKQKAEAILREANIKADDITRDAREQAVEYGMELDRIQTEVAHFKASVLGLYKQHIESLSTLPGRDVMEEEEAPAEEPAEQPAEEAVPAEEPAAEQPAPEAVAEEPAEAIQQEAEQQEETAEEPAAPEVPAEEPAPKQDQPLPSLLNGFQGIKFSD